MVMKVTNSFAASVRLDQWTAMGKLVEPDVMPGGAPLVLLNGAEVEKYAEEHGEDAVPPVFHCGALERMILLRYVVMSHGGVTVRLIVTGGSSDDDVFSRCTVMGVATVPGGA